MNNDPAKQALEARWGGRKAVDALSVVQGAPSANVAPIPAAAAAIPPAQPVDKSL